MKTLIFGGAGFVGLNIAEALLKAGNEAVVFDRNPPPAAALEAFAPYGGCFGHVTGDVTHAASVRGAVAAGIDSIVYGAAITAGPTRDASEPERVLAVNLAALTPVLRAARDFGVRRVINLSSVGALGKAGEGAAALTEDMLPDPVSLYSLTKFASERLVERMRGLWEIDALNVRLSAVFGPWEYATGVRDTLSPPGQVLALAEAGEAALLPRPGNRDWVYAVDVAEAILTLLQAERPIQTLYHITSGMVWSVLGFGEKLAGSRPGFSCRIARAGETANVDLFMPTDRPPLDGARLAAEFGWRGRFGLDEAARDIEVWSKAWAKKLGDEAACG